MIITLTTDFGASEYVAAMKGVILGINRDALIVDVRHDVAPGSVAEGAFAMFHTAPHFPFAVHMGVVDPGVGTERRGLAVVCESAIFVGPDNGLLIPAARRMGIKDVRHLTNDALWRHPVHPTFQGRDVFAPVAAHLTLGAKVADLGPSIRDVVEIDFGRPESTDGGMAAEVIYVDRFGNMVTNIPGTDAESRWPYGATVRVKVASHDFRRHFPPHVRDGSAGRLPPHRRKPRVLGDRRQQRKRGAPDGGPAARSRGPRGDVAGPGPFVLRRLTATDCYM